MTYATSTHANCRRSVTQKSRAPEDRDESLVARVAARFDAPPVDALRIDATRVPEEIAKAILDRLEQFQER
jgi:hypothetical protein